jgi:hypothetical protein
MSPTQVYNCFSSEYTDVGMMNEVQIHFEVEYLFALRYLLNQDIPKRSL